MTRQRNASAMLASTTALVNHLNAELAEWDARLHEELRARIDVDPAEPRSPADRAALACALRDAIAALSGEAEGLRRRIREEHARAGDWELKALLASGQGRDDLARQALERQRRHAEAARALREELVASSRMREEYERSLEAVGQSHAAGGGAG
jgi:phage shock protein A